MSVFHGRVQYSKLTIFIDPAMLGQFECNVQHGQAVESHPSCRISLLQSSASWQGIGAIEETYIVQAEKAAFEDVLAIEVFSIHPPSEVEQQLLEHPFKKVQVTTAIQFTLDLECTEHGPSMNGRVDICRFRVSLILIAQGLLRMTYRQSSIHKQVVARSGACTTLWSGYQAAFWQIRDRS